MTLPCGSSPAPPVTKCTPDQAAGVRERTAAEPAQRSATGQRRSLDEEVTTLSTVMIVDDARDWIDALDARGVRFWVDGGWGVDALLNEQTRPHADLDLVVESHHESVVVGLLWQRGYVEVATPFSTSFHSVWRDGAGREVDLHVITMDVQGNGQFGPHEVYPAAGLQGAGSIGGRAVRCITAQVQLDFHLGYDHDEDDHADVLALCDRFDLPLPSQYRD